MKSEKAVKKLEELLAIKQKNGTVRSISDEIMFLAGGIAMIHELTKHENKNPNALECYPPKYFLSIFGDSINGFKYRKETK